MRTVLPFAALRYLIALMTVALAYLLTQLIPDLQDTCATLFIAAVMVSAWNGGLGPGLVATVLSGLIIDYCFVLPRYSPGKEVTDLVRWIEFMLVAFLVNSLNAKRRQVEDILRRAHQDSELRVQERTAELGRANQALLAENADRKRAEQMLLVTQNRLHNLLAKSPVLIYALNIDSATPRMTWVSDNITRMTGHEPADALQPGWWETHLHPQDRNRVGNGLAELSQQDHCAHEYRHRHKDGTYRWIRDEKNLVRDAAGKAIEVVGSWTDITERKLAEETLQQTEAQLRQAQKMETIGRLAGGVAHDFNNLLMVINANCELALNNLVSDDPCRELLEEVRQSGDRAALLTRQLVAFSRKQVLAPAVLDINALTANMDKMLRRLIGEDVELVTILARGLHAVKADPSQIEQIIINLAVNARDAMPEGGQLTIETSNVELNEAFARLHPEIAPGSYVKLAVSDSGCGMDPETQSHIFEPFFTTKEVGKGTGLGLATVYGIVQQSGGAIEVDSEPGQGTRFTIYLPRVDEVEHRLQQSPHNGEMVVGDETVVVVEDEKEVRTLMGEFLRKQGYNVLEASRGADALRMVEQYPEPIHLLVTDVVMPQMGGRELADHLGNRCPGMKVLFVSGYTEDAVAQRGVREGEMAFLQKPFTLGAFARKVRTVLDESPCLR
jgi:PAS domain S-box-containing protein